MKFTELWQEIESDLKQYIISLSDSEDDAKEILQDTARKAWNHFGTLRNNYAFSKWLRRIARNCAADYYRRPGNKIFLNYSTLDSQNDMCACSHEDTLADQIIIRDVLCKYISALQEYRAKALYLHLIGGYGATKISRMLNLKFETVKKWLHRDKLKIRELLRQDLNENDF